MTGAELAELLRKAAVLASDDGILVVGSQSILGTVRESKLPARATLSQEADIVFLDDPDRRKADLVNVFIGELSEHQMKWGTYAEGVHIDSIVLPMGWQERLARWSREPSSALFLDRHDLCAAKLARGAHKDLDFVGALVDAGIVEPELLLARTGQLQADVDLVQAAVERARAFLGSGPQ